MKQKKYVQISGIIFIVVALLHLTRAVLGWELEIEDYEVPIWVSFVAAGILGYLAYMSQKLKK